MFFDSRKIRVRVNGFLVAFGRQSAQAVDDRPRACGNQTPDDHVFFQADQIVRTARNCGFRQNARRFLEGRRRNEGIRLQAGFRNAEQYRRRFGGTSAGRNGLRVFFFQSRLVDLFALQQRRVARIGDLQFLEHLTRDDFDMLIVNLHALQTVNVLNFFHQIVRQLFNAHNAQNIVRYGSAVNKHIAFIDVVAFLNRNQLALRQQIFAFLTFRIADDNATFCLVILSEFDNTVNIRNNGMILGLARFKQFGNTRQTARDVFCFRAFARDTRQNVAHADFLSLFYGQYRINRQEEAGFHSVRSSQYFAVFIRQSNMRLAFRNAGMLFPVHNDFGRQPRRFVNNFTHRFAVDQIFVFHNTFFVRNDRQRIRIPFRYAGTARDLLAFFDRQAGTVRNAVTCFFTTVRINQSNIAVTRQNNRFAQRVLNRRVVLDFNARIKCRINAGLFRSALSRAADMEVCTVDEKLQTTLQKRISDSFRAVSQQLEQVYKGLGEMQTLAADVGGLKRVLSGVKTRGILGEVQLGGILREILAPGQYAENVATIPGSANRVEYAVRLPGQNGTVWLPIDAKFPADSYTRLLDARDSGDPAAVAAARKQLEQRLRQEAKDIREKYIELPYTTAFGVLFLPFEGLYAEVVSSGVSETLQRDFQISIAGPSTMAALLNALQMGFRTLAIQKRSGEVWQVLAAVKTEFEKFGAGLQSMQRHLNQTGSDLEELIGTRSRAITRRLEAVQQLDPGEASGLLGQDDFLAAPAARLRRRDEPGN